MVVADARPDEIIHPPKEEIVAAGVAQQHVFRGIAAGDDARRRVDNFVQPDVPSRPFHLCGMDEEPRQVPTRDFFVEDFRPKAMSEAFDSGRWERRELVLLSHDAVVTCIQNFAADTNKKPEHSSGF